MAYSTDDIEGDILQRWEEDDFYVLRYWPKKSEYANDTTRLILDFKRNRAEAFKIAVDLILSSIRKFEEEFGEKFKCRKIVSIPPSKAGRGNVPGERVCAILGEKFSWLTHLPNALVRIESVRKSAWAPPGERPDYDDHIRTIRYQGPQCRLTANSILMFDDVITRKATSKACRNILLNATHCRRIIGIYLGRTS